MREDPGAFYGQKEGETERERFERLIRFASKHVGSGDNGFWQKQLNDFKARLAKVKDEEV